MKDNEEVRQYIEDEGYEDVVIFENPDYAPAFIGVSSEGRAIYDYERMVTCLMERDGISKEEAIEFIEYNTLRSLAYVENAPVVLMPVQGGNE